MDVSTDLLSHLSQLAGSIEAETEVLHHPLRTLIGDLRAAVSSYRGLQLTIVHTGQPVTLTDLMPAEADGVVLTSLRIPLIALDPDFDRDSRVIFYAGRPGAFVDLAADLSFALKTSVLTADTDHQDESDGDGRAKPKHRPALRSLFLDIDVPPDRSVLGLTGLLEFAAVNRAVGMMIDRGHHPDHAYQTLRREATAAGVETRVYAAQMLGR